MALGAPGPLSEFLGTYEWNEPVASGPARTHRLAVSGPVSGTSQYQGTLSSTGPQASQTSSVRLSPADGSIDVSFVSVAGGAANVYEPGEVLFTLSGPAAAPVTTLVALETAPGIPANGRYFERTSDPLRLGDRGDRVAALQDQLNVFIGFSDVGMDILREDGQFGPNTMAAVETFERYAGLAVDGVVTRADLAVLDETVGRLLDEAAASTVALGDRGRLVEVWQDQLAEWLELTGSARAGIAVDGVFGAATRAATIEFETSAGVQVDGIVEPVDRVRLRDALARLRAIDDAVVSFDGLVVPLRNACAPDAASISVSTVGETTVRVYATLAGLVMRTFAEGTTTTARSVTTLDGAPRSYIGTFDPAGPPPYEIRVTVGEQLPPCA